MRGNTVILIQTNPDNGTFYHFCGSGSTTADEYLTVGTEAQVDTYLAGGDINGDVFDDLVFIEPGTETLAVLLGNGSPDSNNKIMQFDRNDSKYFYPDYAEDGGTDFDRVICCDLNLDGDDDIIISRFSEFDITGGYWIVVIQNSGTVWP